MRDLRHIVPILALLTSGLLATSLGAAPRTIKDCEKIQAADAYNRCLASFGPVAHDVHLVPVPPGADRMSYAYRHRHGVVLMRHRHRMRTMLD